MAINKNLEDLLRNDADMDHNKQTSRAASLLKYILKGPESVYQDLSLRMRYWAGQSHSLPAAKHVRVVRLWFAKDEQYDDAMTTDNDTRKCSNAP